MGAHYLRNGRSSYWFSYQKRKDRVWKEVTRRTKLLLFNIFANWRRVWRSWLFISLQLMIIAFIGPQIHKSSNSLLLYNYYNWIDLIDGCWINLMVINFLSEQDRFLVILKALPSACKIGEFQSKFLQAKKHEIL